MFFMVHLDCLKCPGGVPPSNHYHMFHSHPVTNTISWCHSDCVFPLKATSYVMSGDRQRGERRGGEADCGLDLLYGHLL